MIVTDPTLTLPNNENGINNSFLPLTYFYRKLKTFIVSMLGHIAVQFTYRILR